MKFKAITGIMLTLLLMSILPLVFNIQPVKASGTIYIKSDGSIDPPTTPIHRDGNVYTFTADIYYDTIVVEKDNVVIDGGGYILQGLGADYPWDSIGVSLSARSNVLIKKMKIEAFDYGIYLNESSSNTITESTIANNGHGIWLAESSSNNMYGNDIIATNDYYKYGITLMQSHDNIVERNVVTAINDYLENGINLLHSDWNKVRRNIITDMSFIGIKLQSSEYNQILENYLDRNDWMGIFVNESPSNNIFSNYVANSLGIFPGEDGQGILLQYSDHNLVYGNILKNNENSGLYLIDSDFNIISQNNFVDNLVHQAFQIDSTYGNIWNHPYDAIPPGGNYWSTYSGVDTKSGPNQDQPGSDGIGDTPYIVNGEPAHEDYPLKDFYPFMEPTTSVDPVGDLAEETTSDVIRSADLDGDGNPDFGWTSGYDISFTSRTLHIEINIELVGDDPGDELRQQWEEGTEEIWSDSYDIVDGIFTYPIDVEVNWVDVNPHHVVTVHSGLGRHNMLNWYTETDWGSEYQDEIAAHEVGHMLGLYDEYEGGALDPDTLFTTTNSLMADLGPTRSWHYEHILEWLETKSGRDLSLAQSPLPPYELDDPIPDFSDPQPPYIPPVGGIYIPVNKLSLLAPYIGLTVLLAVAVTTVVLFKHKRKKSQGLMCEEKNKA